MTTRIELRNSRYRYGGRTSSNTSWGEIEDDLRTYNSLRLLNNARPDFFIAGASALSLESKARAKGIPVISVDDILAAIEVGHIDYEEKIIDEDLDVNTVISELRASFDGPATSEAWTRCLEYIERCPDAQLEPVLHYIRQGISSWSSREVMWEPPQKHALLTGIPKKWARGCPTDELCVAPPVWIYEMTRVKKLYHQKHTLIRALNLDELRMSFNTYRRLLDNPYLTNLRILNLGVRSNCTEAVYKLLSSHPTMAHVEELWIHGSPDEFANGITPNTAVFQNLKRIKIFHLYFPKSLRKRLEKFPCFAQGVEFTSHATYNY